MKNRQLRIAFFGSSLVSAYWNGAATYYRGIIRALHQRGHTITFYEPDAYERQAHRDLEKDPPYARSVVYAPTKAAADRVLAEASECDVIIKTSGVGVLDDYLERRVLEIRRPHTMVAFWDVDAPATLDRLQNNRHDPFAELVPEYDIVLTYGGGKPVINAYREQAARDCVPIYNAFDADTHHPVEPVDAFHATLAFLGNRLPDREARVKEFFFKPADAMPGSTFMIGGSGWDAQDVPRRGNVKVLGHVYTRDHNAFNCTPFAVLNISRESMARYGFSPATRVFEAAGSGACMITDAWEGIEHFLTPGRECLVAADGDEVIAHLRTLSVEQANAIGKAAMRRVLHEHTYAHRAEQVESVLLEQTALRKEMTA